MIYYSVYGLSQELGGEESPLFTIFNITAAMATQ